jgi:phosphate starvation-inducible PhoH-like protein
MSPDCFGSAKSNERVHPYLRPIYDALYEMLGFDKVEKLLNKNIIEVAPLAFMRGRTLKF